MNRSRCAVRHLHPDGGRPRRRQAARWPALLSLLRTRVSSGASELPAAQPSADCRCCHWHSPLGGLIFAPSLSSRFDLLAVGGLMALYALICRATGVRSAAAMHETDAGLARFDSGPAACQAKGLGRRVAGEAVRRCVCSTVMRCVMALPSSPCSHLAAQLLQGLPHAASGFRRLLMPSHSPTVLGRSRLAVQQVSAGPAAGGRHGRL